MERWRGSNGPIGMHGPWRLPPPRPRNQGRSILAKQLRKAPLECGLSCRRIKRRGLLSGGSEPCGPSRRVRLRAGAPRDPAHGGMLQRPLAWEPHWGERGRDGNRSRQTQRSSSSKKRESQLPAEQRPRPRSRSPPSRFFLSRGGGAAFGPHPCEASGGMGAARGVRALRRRLPSRTLGPAGSSKQQQRSTVEDPFQHLLFWFVCRERDEDDDEEEASRKSHGCLLDRHA
mmetsp:Transcript_68660/g.134867  ORF Transcript_68660/g.134867 Transcript_68660/m.134867 type:complete len:230 (+) Transcript_68660:262-951(+)